MLAIVAVPRIDPDPGAASADVGAGKDAVLLSSPLRLPGKTIPPLC